MCCTGKIEYKTAQEAHAIKNKMNPRRHGRADVYHCPFCGKFHTGRKKTK